MAMFIFDSHFDSISIRKIKKILKGEKNDKSSNKWFWKNR